MPIMKVLGMIFVLVSCSILGIYKSKSEIFRIDDLLEFKRIIMSLQSEIEYSLTPLPQAFIKISNQSKNNIGGFFNAVGTTLEKREGQALGIAWQEQLSELTNKSFLGKEDLDFFVSLGNNLGKMDRQLQVNSMKMTTDYIDCKIDALRQLSLKNRRMYLSFGVLIGVLLVVVLF